MRDSAPSDPLSQLFRPEVLATQGYSATGGIRMTQSLSTWSIVAASVMVLAALLGYVLLGSVTNKARVSGLVVPASGSVNISSPNAGIIVRSLVAEGQSVKAGQALFELSTARHLDVGEMTTLVDRQLANRKRALEEDLRLLSTTYSEKVASLQAKLDNQKSELVQAEQEATLIQQRIGLSKQSLEQYQSLQTKARQQINETNITV
jgi:membrane fusion protein